jgi:hypothetical protein
MRYPFVFLTRYLEDKSSVGAREHMLSNSNQLGLQRCPGQCCRSSVNCSAPTLFPQPQTLCRTRQGRTSPTKSVVRRSPVDPPAGCSAWTRPVSYQGKRFSNSKRNSWRARVNLITGFTILGFFFWISYYKIENYRQNFSFRRNFV